MSNLNNTSKLVKSILEEDIKARNSDNYLYYIICATKLKERGIDIDCVSLKDALLFRKKYGLPNFETVRRSRQKMQEKFPWLAGIDVKEARKEREEEYRQFARGIF